MINNVILGDGITGYVIAACLNYNNEDFKIYGNGKYSPPAILLLKYKSQYELLEYFNIFEIPYSAENIDKYTKAIRVGYTNDFKTILDKPTPEMKRNYLEKQNREATPSAMSDDLTTFYGIDLKLVYEHLKKKYKKHFVLCDVKKENFKSLVGCTIYNTIFPTEFNNNEPSIEYVSVDKTNLKGYNYIYDCNKNSRIKRITPECVEYISSPGHYDFTIKNYYDAPRIYTITNPKTQCTWVDIGRNATRTQTKQEDIIKYIVKYE